MAKGPYSKLHARHIKEFADVVQQIDIKDDDTFADMLCCAVHHYGISIDGIAAESSHDRTTVSRWVNGHSFPHVSKRKGIVQYVLEQCRAAS